MQPLCIAARMAEELLSKIGIKSVALNYFGLTKGSDGNATDDGGAICRTCCQRILANTSNLVFHLKINHPKLYEDAMKTEHHEVNQYRFQLANQP